MGGGDIVGLLVFRPIAARRRDAQTLRGRAQTEAIAGEVDAGDRRLAAGYQNPVAGMILPAPADDVREFAIAD